MNEELARLEEELAEVESSELEYLPKYGYSLKEEIIALIKEDIDEVKSQITERDSYCSEYELEEERMRLCTLQGIPRYC